MKSVALVLGLFLSAFVGTSAATVQELGPRSCVMPQLTVTFGPDISAATGQHPLSVRLTNHGRGACVVEDYPAIWLSDRAGTVPFVIRHGGDQMVTSSRPTRVLVRPDHSAFVLLNHYRCDRGDVRIARKLRLGLPNATRSASTELAIRRPLARISYCGKGDPGSTLSVSPFEPSVRAALQC